MPRPKLNPLTKTNLRDVVSSFMTDRQAMGVSDKTLSLYKFELERFTDWLNENGVIHLEDMTAMIIREYIVAMQEQGRNEGGRHCAYRVIRTMSYFWEQETEGEYIAAIRKVKIKSPPDEPIEPISLSDINRLLAECDNDWGGVRDTRCTE